MTKSKDLMSDIFSGQTSRLYNNIETHLLYNSCKMSKFLSFLLVHSCNNARALFAYYAQWKFHDNDDKMMMVYIYNDDVSD